MAHCLEYHSAYCLALLMVLRWGQTTVTHLEHPMVLQMALRLAYYLVELLVLRLVQQLVAQLVKHLAQYLVQHLDEHLVHLMAPRLVQV